MIVASAVWHYGTLFTGVRHCHCIKKAVEETGIKPVIGDQGFVTDHGKYLNRAKAAKHALECGQISKLKHSTYKLFSEDLW